MTPVAPIGQPATSPSTSELVTVSPYGALRAFDRTHDIACLKEHIEPDFMGMSIARFEATEYLPGDEQILRNLGAKLVVIRNPGELDLATLTEEQGYFHKPGKVSWWLPVSSFDSYLEGLCSKERTNFRSRLRKSSKLETTVEPLSSSNYQGWFEVYEKEICNRDRGRRWLTADSMGDLVRQGNSFLVSLRAKGSDEVLGGAIIVLDRASLTATIGYAACSSEIRSLVPSLNLFRTALEFSLQQGCQRLSHGFDSNFYGYYLQPGLLEFKSSLGFIPEPGSNTELVKILDRNSFAQDCYFFEETKEGLGLVHIGTSSTQLKLPPGCTVRNVSPDSETPTQAARITAFDFLTAAARVDLADTLSKISNEVVGDHKALRPLNLKERDVPPWHLPLRLIDADAKGYPAIERLLTYLNTTSSGIAPAEETNRYSGKLASYLTEEALSDPTLIPRLANLIGASSHADNFRYMTVHILDSLFGTTETLEPIPTEIHWAGVMQLLHSISETQGKEGLRRFLLALNSIDPLDQHVHELDAIYPVEALRPTPHLTLHDLQLDRFFARENTALAWPLIERLYQRLLRCEPLPNYDTGTIDMPITGTYGGERVAYIAYLLRHPRQALEMATDSKDKLPHPLEVVDGPLLKDMQDLAMLSLHNGAVEGVVPTLQDRAVAQLAEHIRSDISLRRILIFSSIDPESIHYWGRTPRELAQEILGQATKEELNDIFNSVREDSITMKRDGGPLTADEVAALPHSEVSTLPKLMYSPQEIREASVRLSSMLALAHHPAQFLYWAIRSLATEEQCYIPRLIDSHLDDGLVILRSPFDQNPCPPNDFEAATRPSHDGATFLTTLLANNLSPAIPNDSMLKVLNSYSKSSGRYDELIGFGAFNTIEGVPPALISKSLEYLGELAGKRPLQWPHLIFVIRALTTEGCEEQALSAMRKINGFSYIENQSDPLRGNMVLVDRMFRSLDLSTQTRELVYSELSALLARSAAAGPGNDFENAPSSSTALCCYRVLQALSLDTSMALDALERAVPVAARSVVSAAQAITNGEAWMDLPADRDRLAVIYFGALSNITSGPERNSSGMLWHGGIFSEFAHPLLKLEWNSDLTPKVTFALVQWMHCRLNGGYGSSRDAASFIERVAADEDQQVNSELFALSISFLRWVTAEEDRARVFPVIRDRLQHFPFIDGATLWYAVDTLRSMEDVMQVQLLDSVLFQPEVVGNHPWSHYGYSKAAEHRIREFMSTPNLTPARVESVFEFIIPFSRSAKSLRWVEEILQSVPGSGLGSLAPFLDLWRSMPAEARANHVNQRFKTLQTELRQQAAKKLNGSAFTEIERKLEEQKQTGTVSRALESRYERAKLARQTLQELSETRDSPGAAKLLQSLDGQIESLGFKLKIRAENERRLILRQRQVFFTSAASRLNPNDPENIAFQKWAVDEREHMDSTGMLMRIVQFCNFANQTGLEVLGDVLRTYADPTRTRKVQVTRPDLNGRKTVHYDYFGKFDHLAQQLRERGLDEKQLKSFMGKWSELWAFVPDDKHESQTLSVTHDLERWLKHGDEPVRTCQRISAPCNNMDPSNWNFQFSPTPNADGKPLGRILEPQYKLAELRSGRHLVARTILEITSVHKENGADLALLVEVVYSDEDHGKHEASIHRLVADYAEQLGILKENIFFPKDAANAPTVLPQNYRVYRDSFRH